MKIHRRVLSLLVLGTMVTVSACGNDTDFGGLTGSKTSDAEPEEPKKDPEDPREPEGPDDPQVLPPPYAGLTWYWQCETDPGEIPEPTEEVPVVEGEGPHAFDPARFKGTPVTFTGKLCPPEALQRDILFVIDVSGSMVDNDPPVNGTCGRMQAIEAVIAKVKPGIGRFGLVTFGDLAASSSALFESKDDLFADVAPNGDLARVVCAIGNGTTYDGLTALGSGTNYNAALTKAQQILPFGRAGATKEIYMVSDGQPNFGQNGVAVANSLKNVGVDVGGTVIPVTIATVMLQGIDTVLERSIASTDVSGRPMHAFVANADQLAETLASLAENEIVSGELSYRPIGSVTWTTLDLLDHSQDFVFTLPSFTIEEDTAPEGIEVYYEYKDAHGNIFTGGGKLLWTVKDDAPEEG